MLQSYLSVIRRVGVCVRVGVRLYGCVCACAGGCPCVWVSVCVGGCPCGVGVHVCGWVSVCVSTWESKKILLEHKCSLSISVVFSLCRYFFVRFHLREVYDVYGAISFIQKWCPLLVLVMFGMDRVGMLCKPFSKLPQVEYWSMSVCIPMK